MQTIDVSPALYIWLLWHDWDAARDRAQADTTSTWELFDLGEEHRIAWLAIAELAVPEWIRFYPGTRPPMWWQFSAPELRRMTGGTFTEVVGAHRCQPTGVPYGAPDWNDPPMVESQPAYLDRLNLWLPGEQARVTKEDFAPRRFSWDLTVAPQGVPDGWDLE